MKKLRFKLKELRVMKGLTQNEVAKKAGVRQATISDLETGKSERITFDLLLALSDILDTPPGKFFV